MDAVRAVKGEMQKDEATTAATIFIPAILDIILQQVAGGFPRKDVSKAEEIVENAIKLVKAAIIHPYGKISFFS